MVRIAWIIIVIGIGIPLKNAHAANNGTLGEAVDSISVEVKELLKGDNRIRLDSIDPQKEVEVGNGKTVPAVSRFSTAGPAFVNEFRRAFKAKKIEIDPNAVHKFVVTFNEAEHPTTPQQFIEINWKLILVKTNVVVFNSQSRGFVEDQQVWNEGSIGPILGIPVELSPNGTKDDRIKELKEIVDKPSKVVLKDTKIKTSEESPFAIEILTAPADDPRAGKRDAADYRIQKPKVENPKDGLAFVPIARDQVYAVRLINNANFDAAINLRVDGLSLYTFSDKKFRDEKDQPIYRYLVVPKNSSVLIRGWHVTNDDSDEFLVTSYAKSAVGQLASSANVGTITASFHAAWPKKGTPPADEPKKPGEFAQSADATGRGKRFDQKYVETESEVGVLRSAISVRYSK